MPRNLPARELAIAAIDHQRLTSNLGGKTVVHLATNFLTDSSPDLTLPPWPLHGLAPRLPQGDTFLTRVNKGLK